VGRRGGGGGGQPRVKDLRLVVDGGVREAALTPPILRRSSADPPRQRPPRPAGRRRFTDEELRAVFDSIDTSGDGEICVAELQVAIRTVAAKADDIDKAVKVATPRVLGAHAAPRTVHSRVHTSVRVSETVRAHTQSQSFRDRRDPRAFLVIRLIVCPFEPTIVNRFGVLYPL
jgi:hypothetical protein